jgi:hypothetical protein
MGHPARRSRASVNSVNFFDILSRILLFHSKAALVNLNKPIERQSKKQRRTAKPIVCIYSKTDL